MADLRIRIGASLDANMRFIFRPLVQSARDARKEIDKIFTEQAKSADKANKDRANSTRKRVKDEVDEERRAAREKERIDKDLNRARESLDRQRQRGLYQQFQQEQRMRRQMARAEQREAERFARRTSHRTTRFLTPNAPIASTVRRAGSDILRGAGVEMTLQGITRNIVEGGKLATAITTQAYQKGESGAAGKRVDPKELALKARDLGTQVGLSKLDILRGAQAFVGQRGNLAGFRKLAPGIAQRAAAQQIDMGELSLTAAKFDSALVTQGKFRNDDVRNKAIIELLDNMIRQGKVGSVEGAKMTKEMPKISGIAAQFSGDIVGNLKELVTVLQLAERGPGKNAAVSGTFAQNFATGFIQNAGRFKDVAGIDVFTKEGGQSKIRGIRQLVLETLAATEQDRTVNVKGKGSVELNQLQQLKAMLPNKRQFMAIQEFYNVFSGAGGGAAGLKAVQQEFENFGGSNASQNAEDLAAWLDTSAAKAQIFSNKLEGVADRSGERLAKAFERLEPHALALAETLADLVEYVASNPLEAAFLGLAAVLTRAALESALRAGIERSILGKPGGGGGVGRKTGSALAGAGIGLTVGTVILTAGVVNFDQKENINKTQGQLLVQAREAARTGDVDEVQRIQREMRQLDKELNKPGMVESVFGKTFANYIGQGTDPAQKKTSEAFTAEAVRLEMQAMKNSMKMVENKLNGELQVRVTNQLQEPPPGVDSRGRAL